MNCTHKQKGAVMLEAAYVLPLMVVMIILVVEALSFALTSFAVNDVLTDVHTAIIGEVSEVANADSFAKITPPPSYVSCENKKVKIIKSSELKITELVDFYLAKKKIAVKSGSVAKINVPDVISGFDVYVIEYEAKRESLVFLPNFVAEYLPINVDTIITIKDSCIQ